MRHWILRKEYWLMSHVSFMDGWRKIYDKIWKKIGILLWVVAPKGNQWMGWALFHRPICSVARSIRIVLGWGPLRSDVAREEDRNLRPGASDDDYNRLHTFFSLRWLVGHLKMYLAGSGHKTRLLPSNIGYFVHCLKKKKLKIEIS